MKHCRLPDEKGLTLLEMVMASFILFLVSISLIELFVFGLSAVQRSRIFSTTAFLAAGAAERLLPVPADSLSTTPAPFPLPFAAEYQTSISVSSYDPQLNLVTVTVTALNGTTSTYSFLKRLTSFAGVSTDIQSSKVNSANKLARDIKAYNGDTFTTPLTSSQPVFPSLPTISGRDGKPGGVAQDIFWNSIWTGDQANRTVYVTTTDTLTPSWTGVAAPSPSLGTPTGLATDSYASSIWVGDAYNKGIRLYDSSTNTWGALINLPNNIGEPAGVATDYYGNVVWVANVTTKTIQIYNVASASWQTDIKPAAGFTGAPRGVAVTGEGEWLWVADLARLWQYDTNTDTWTFYTLPAGINTPDSMVQGLATDRFGSIVWLYSKDNQLWVFDGSGFTKKLP